MPVNIDVALHILNRYYDFVILKRVRNLIFASVCQQSGVDEFIVVHRVSQIHLAESVDF